MRYSGVGGQAVMEGVMMKNREAYAVAVRKPDQTIETKVSEYNGTIKNKKIRKLPIIRGVINFVESLYLGMSTLMFSASFFEDEEEEVAKKNRESMTVFGFQKGDDITLDKINKKRRELMRLHHPDAGGSLEMSQTINAAYDYLCSKI